MRGGCESRKGLLAPGAVQFLRSGPRDPHAECQHSDNYTKKRPKAPPASAPRCESKILPRYFRDISEIFPRALLASECVGRGASRTVLPMPSLPSSSSSSALAVAGLAVASALLAKALLRRWRIARMTKAGAKRIDLLPSECSPIIRQSPPTTTVTFFLGDVCEAEAKLEAKVAAIVRANPWLESTLEEADCWSKRLAAFYPTGSGPCFSVRRDLAVKRVVSGTSSMRDYNDLVDSVRDVTCKTTDESVGRSTPLWRVTLLPRVVGDSSGGSCYALVVSANHSLMDGHG